MSAKSSVASTVLTTVSSMKTSRRRLAAICQGSMAKPDACGRATTEPVNRATGHKAAAPRLFQKPRHGRGAMEPRRTGGAVTAFG